MIFFQGEGESGITGALFFLCVYLEIGTVADNCCYECASIRSPTGKFVQE